MRKPVLIKFISVVFAFLVLAGCGAGGAKSPSFTGSGTPTTPTTPATPTTGTAAVASVKLIASSSQLPSSASTSTSTGAVGLTAIVKDAKNNLLNGVAVTFASAAKAGTSCGKGGGVTPGGTTAADGTAKSILSTSGDQVNQIITVTATAGGVSDTVDIPVTGTSLKLTGASSVSSGNTVTYKVALSDSSGGGLSGQTITIASANSNILVSGVNVATTNVITGTDGTGTFSYKGTTGGTDTLTANLGTGCATAATASVVVSNTSLTFSFPASGATIPLGTTQPITINYKIAGVNVPDGTPMDFTTTRGVFTGANIISGAGTASARVNTSGGLGNATINVIQAAGPNTVGNAIITVSNGTGAGIVSATLPVEFISTTAAKVVTQATPTTVAANTGTSVITAVVRDVNNNPVKGQTVNFTVSGSGALATPTNVITDSSGVASIGFTAGPTVGKDAATVTSTVAGVPTSSVKLTVNAQSVSIVLGTGNTVASAGSFYQLPYSVLVTDSGGNPAKNATVSLVVESVAYQKGVLTFPGTGPWQLVTPVPVPGRPQNPDDCAGGPPCNDPSPNSPPFGCFSEDVNRNGILDKKTGYTEDTDPDGVLDPGGVASVATSVITSDGTAAGSTAGTADFNLTYPKDHAYWVQVRLTATATVAGTEGKQYADIVLPGAAADYSSKTVAPPGQTSPYGQGLSASCTVHD